jgi:glycerophosphoryl diester phosphodiesterase
MKYWLLLFCWPWLALAAPPGPRVLGHAGSGFFTPISPFNFRPPSSWRGVQHALDVGAAGVEVDLQLSQDSVVMLFHDVRLDNITRATGCVSQYPAAALTQLRYRGGLPYDLLQRERPITFDTLLARFSRLPHFPHLHLDLHENDACAPAGQRQARTAVLLRRIAASLARYHVPAGEVMLTTEEESTLHLAQRLAPGLHLAYEVTTAEPAAFAAALRRARAAHAGLVVLAADKTEPTHVAQAHAAGLRVVVFGGRSGRNIRHLLASHPDEVEADNPRRLLRLLRQQEPLVAAN